MADNHKPIIGKAVIEHLTIGMYSDPRAVYREYVQNSADAIDKAEATGLLSRDEGEIHVDISQESKSISFYDNGTGVPSERVRALLQNVAQSEKDIGDDKGFRGIGRLGGLAYCDQLIFETSILGEATVSKMIWDAKMLRTRLADRATKESAADLIHTVTSFASSNEEADKHYFRVYMLGVRHAPLLDVGDVRDYLSFVAPVPYDSSFIFRSKIHEAMKSDGVSVDEYALFVNTERIYKGFKTGIYKDGRRVGEVTDIETFKELDKDGKPLYWGWHSVSDMQNSIIPPVNSSRGLRVRKHNIQIGDEFILEKLFKETRFNLYVMGEVHTFSRELVPNGRRDNFEENSAYGTLRQRLKAVCIEIERLCNSSSKIGAAQKKIETFFEAKRKLDEEQKGTTSREKLHKLEAEVKEKKHLAEQGQKTLSKFHTIAQAEPTKPIAKVFNRLVKDAIPDVKSTKVTVNSKKPVFRTDKLTKLDRGQRKFLAEIFTVIESVLSPEVAESVIKKIEEKFS